MTRALLLAVLVACGKPAEHGTARDCFGYTAPPGWQPQASKTQADLVLVGPTAFVVGDQQMRDNFIVRFLPVAGSLDDFETQLLAAMTPANVDHELGEQAREHPELPKLSSGVPTPAITRTTLAGRDAFRLDTRNTIGMGSEPVAMVAATVFTKFGRHVVSISTGYVLSREAEVKPLAVAFLASVNFDRCK